MKKTKIMIVDDHKLLSSGLTMLLNAQEDLEVAASADTPDEALQFLENECVDLVLLDISLAGKSGLDLLPEILAACPESRVIMMTMHEDLHYLKTAMEGGAKGFVLKKGVGMDLMYAIKAVMNGEVYIQPSMLTGFISGSSGRQSSSEDELLTEDAKLWQLLSPREQEVVQAVAKGHTSREIAEKYFLSEKTVATYRSRAMTKLDFETRADLVDFIIRLGRIGPGD